MSLTSELADPKSSISQWMEAHADRGKITAMVKEINNILAAHIPLVVVGTEPTVVGTAFDYGFRWLLGPLVSENLVAMEGANRGSSYECRRLMPSVLTRLVEDGNASPDLQKRAQATIIMAWCESCFRQTKYVPRAFLTVFPLDEETPGVEEVVDSAEVRTTIDKLYAQIHPQTLQDVVQLLETVPSVWGDDLKQSYIRNPTFEGSSDVGGADADWILGNVLYDCKCTKNKRPFERQTLLQLLGYVLLDYSDRRSIRGVGWYFARQQVRVRYPLQDFLNRVCATDDLRGLRWSLADALR